MAPFSALNQPCNKAHLEAKGQQNVDKVLNSTAVQQLQIYRLMTSNDLCPDFLVPTW